MPPALRTPKDLLETTSSPVSVARDAAPEPCGKRVDFKIVTREQVFRSQAAYVGDSVFHWTHSCIRSYPEKEFHYIIRRGRENGL